LLARSRGERVRVTSALPKRWVAGSAAVQGIIAKGRQLIADPTAFTELSTELGHDD
jgi:hypothetical protein